MKLNLNTIILYVQNVHSLKKFYTHVLGLEVIEDDGEGWVLLRAGCGCIGLHKIGDVYLNKIEEGYKFDNNTKLVFEIQEDIEKVRKSLLEKQALMQTVKTFDNYEWWLCDGQDPEGNVFQLKQRKDAAK